MLGQGRPVLAASVALDCRVRQPASVQTAVRWCAVTIAAALCLGVGAIAPAQDRLFEQPIRIRIAWGGAAAERWTGQVALEGGTLSDAQLLGMEADAAATVWLENNELRIDSPSPHLFDGADVTVTAASDARLVVTLATGENGTPVHAQVALADVLKKPYHLPLGDRGNELLIQRAPGDTLRISTNRSSLIFRPGEQFTFDVQPLVEGLDPSTTIDITTTLSPARGGNSLWSHEQRLPVPVEGPAIATMHVPLPREEGVYEVRLSVARPPGFRQRFLPGGGALPLVERTFQVVVLTEQPPMPANEASWTTVLEIDPANPGWTERLPSWTQIRRIPGFASRPLGSLRAATVVHPLGNFVELSATPAGGEPHWQAYPLPLEAIGRPHVLEIEYPNDQEQHLGISIIEPNASGRAVPIGRDSGVYVEGLGHAEHVEKSKHRVVFWPRTNAPLLLVTNQHPTAPGRFGAVRVMAGKSATIAATPWPASPSTDRLIAAYIARPLVPETFGASEGLDPASGQSVDDWRTFYEGAIRLADYVNYGGYNAAIVNMMSDGSPLFISERVPTTPLHNTGRMAAGTNDLPVVDVLEIMLQIFDRANLALVPSLQFAAPLPELEALRRGQNSRQSGIELVNAEGRTWRDVHGTDRGLAPYYNLLDERVQQAMLNVARDIIQRYGNHRSLTGLGVQLSARGYAILPGLEWGLDETTLDRFERDTDIRLAGGRTSAIGARQATLLAEHADAWREWRAAQVTRFYRDLAKLVQANDSRRRLVLTTEEMFATPELAARVRPNVVAKTRVDRTMLELGVHRDALRGIPGVVFCPTRYVESMVPLVDRAVDLEINEAFSTAREEMTEQSTAAMLLYHRPRRQSLPSFDAKSPFPSHTLLVTQSTAHGPLALRPYVASLLDADPTVLIDGGELLPLGEADQLRQTRSILRALPIHASATKREQNILVRTYERDGETVLLVVNELPWQAESRLSLEVPAATTATPVSGESGSPIQAFTAGSQNWPLTLAPYEVRAMRFAAGGVEVTAIESQISEAGRRELAARRADLRSRDLNTVQNYPGLVNPGFEPPAAGASEGWRLVDANGKSTAELDATSPQDGTTCILLQNRGADSIAVLESNAFPTPPTGQLAMWVFVRGQNLGPNSEVRLVFEVEGTSKPFRRFTTLGGSRPGSQPLGGEWAAGYAFRCEDLPLDSRSKMRVKFELAGPGEVWIDNVKLYHLLFPLPFYAHAKPEKFEFVKLITAVENALDEGKLSECVELLEGYWPRFLSAYTPLDRVKIVEQPALPDAPPAEEPPQEEPPSMIGRWFSWPGTQKR
jgi:hypothetical protein